MRTRLMIVVLGLLGVAVAGAPARSEPLRVALIIANAKYSGMPEVARCTASAALVRDALRRKDFEVVERSDLGRGAFDAAIGGLARRATATSPTIVALYYCGYALEFNGRSFLLPASANITRENDVLTQGIISKSLVDSLARVAESSGFVLLDTFLAPGASSSGMARLVEQVHASGFAVIGASNDVAGQGPTPAAQALRDQLAGERVTLEKFVTGLRTALGKDAVIVAPTSPAAFLVGSPAPPPPVATPLPPPPAASPQPAPVAVQPPPAHQPSTPPRIVMVDEDRMSDQERRQVQAVLATMGYYSGRVDGAFGPETKAAIRRYQFEIKAEQTGHLTAEQATRLVNSVR